MHCIKDKGKIIFLTSSLANHQKLLEKIKSLGFNVEIVGSKKLFYEKLLIVSATKT